MRHRQRASPAASGWQAAGLCWALALIPCFAAGAPAAELGSEDAGPRRYTYSWLFSDADAMRPRGGTTRGLEVTLAASPSESWRLLAEPGLSRLERDRRAIVAMAGAYRTTFDFIETIGFTPDYQPRPPYQSWGTEYIYVVTDQPRFISLQHVLVMTFAPQDGAPSEPVVVKHWRQDWHYQDGDIHVYAGHGRWQRRELDPEQVDGAWTQAVFQVDDSPRYQAVGRWQHHGNHSTWTSVDTWRPLPRRESTVRDDYHVLAGINRVTITPQGWTHEEDNLKVVLEADGRPADEAPYLAREAGLNRYQPMVGYDFSAGDEYWRQTAPFWREVRLAWDALFARRDALAIRPTVDGEPLFQVMFALAEQFGEAPAFDRAAARRAIDATLKRFVE